MGPNPRDTGAAYLPGINQVGSALQNVICLANALAAKGAAWRAAGAHPYAPAPGALALASAPLPRVVRSWFGNGTSDRYNFVATNYSIGTASEAPCCNSTPTLTVNVTVTPTLHPLLLCSLGPLAAL